MPKLQVPELLAEVRKRLGRGKALGPRDGRGYGPRDGRGGRCPGRKGEDVFDPEVFSDLAEVREALERAESGEVTEEELTEIFKRIARGARRLGRTYGSG